MYSSFGCFQLNSDQALLSFYPLTSLFHRHSSHMRISLFWFSWLEWQIYCWVVRPFEHHNFVPPNLPPHWTLAQLSSAFSFCCLAYFWSSWPHWLKSPFQSNPKNWPSQSSLICLISPLDSQQSRYSDLPSHLELRPMSFEKAKLQLVVDSL